MTILRKHGRWLGVAVIAALVALARWRHPPETTTTTDTPPATIPVHKPARNPSETPTAPPPAEPRSPVTILDFASDLERELIRTDNPDANLQAVDQVLYFYRRAFGENPVGQNEDITAALLGENKKRVAFLPPDSPAIKEGKLVDPWGTPYWFHPLSGREMEIRSAGPDRELFTADDLGQSDIPGAADAASD